jgi:hypothetical protein
MKMLTMMMALGLVVGVATASTTEYWIQDNPDTNEWYLVASVSPSDNGGLAMFVVSLDSNWATILLRAPQARPTMGGMTFGRSANNTSPIQAAHQPLDNSQVMFYGFGQKVVDMTLAGAKYTGLPNTPTQTGQALGTTVNGWELVKPAAASYDYGIILAIGTYTTTCPGVDTSQGKVMTVWTNSGPDQGAYTASRQTHDSTPVYLGIVPEPTTIGFLVIGALALIRRKR